MPAPAGLFKRDRARRGWAAGVLYAYPVRSRVTPLRRNGVRLRRGEWPQPVTGDLRIRDLDARTNSYRRHLRLAELWEVGLQSQRLILTPIADPEILATAEGGFILAGTELHPEAGRVAEYRQLWLCVPV